MTNTSSNILPQNVTVDKLDGNLCMITLLVGSVEQIETSVDTKDLQYNYKTVSIKLPYRDGIKEDIENNFQTWLNFITTSENDKLASELRNKRNVLLQETDKYMIPDYPITEEQLEQVKIYREYLRDFTESANFPNIDEPVNFKL